MLALRDLATVSKTPQKTPRNFFEFFFEKAIDLRNPLTIVFLPLTTGQTESISSEPKIRSEISGEKSGFALGSN